MFDKLKTLPAHVLLFRVIFIPATALLALITVFSLEWRMVHDSPIMFYLAWLMDHRGYIPYTEFFDMNMPGTYFFFMIIGRLFGYTDFGFRLADVIWFLAILFVTWKLMRRFGRRPAWGACVLYGLVYFGHGSFMSLQREVLLILPVVGTVLVLFSESRWSALSRCWLAGLLMGAAAAVKPHVLVAAPVILIFYFIEQRKCEADAPVPVIKILGRMGMMLTGFLVPLLLMFAYLWRVGALADFREIVVNYWPLYGNLTGQHRTSFGTYRLIYLYRGFLGFGGLSFWFMPAALGAYLAFFNSNLERRQKRFVLMIILLVFCFSLYPVFAGKFWTYHWFPFHYFLILICGLCLIDPPEGRGRMQRIFPVLLILLVMIGQVHTPRAFFGQLRGGRYTSPPKIKEVDEMAAFLSLRLRGRQKVQPLDWAGGALQAMLKARAEVATRFVYDFHFYHHLSKEYIRSLRPEFMSSLDANQPRFIIKMTANREYVHGPDTTVYFPELYQYIEDHYTVAKEGVSYIIYEKKRPAAD